MADSPRCPSCDAPVSARATSCAICDAALVPSAATSGSLEPISGFTTDETPAIAEELRPIYNQLSQALAPTIRVTRLLGEGGMGLVFVGQDTALRREVAIKVLSPALADDSVARARFKREAAAAAAVSHPNIVSVFQVGELAESRIPFFVMQYVEGPTLADAVGHVIPEARVRRLVVEVASALAAAHRRHLVHRDVKPGNVVLDGETGRALVLDFGITAALSSRRKSRSSRLTTEGMYVGTPTYMSPEQASGDEVTPKSDVYTLGIVAFELITGHPPFQGSVAQIMSSHVKEPPPDLHELRPDISSELVAVVERCLEKDPVDRPTAMDVVHFLEPRTKPAIAWPPPGLHRLRRAGAGLLALLSWVAAATLAFFGVLAAQPSLTLAGARTPGALRAEAAELAALWSFLLGACVVVLVLTCGLLLVRGWTTMSLARGARLAGYPLSVVLDVATDNRLDTSDLKNGTGRFALFTDEERGWLLRLRKWQAALAAISFASAVGVTIVWITGLPALVSPLTSNILPPREAVAVVAPIVACLLAAIVALQLELRLLRRVRAGYGRRPSTPGVRREVVLSWLTAAGEAAQAPRRLLPRGMLTLALFALSGGAAATAAAVLVVVGETTTRLIFSRPRAVQLLASLSASPYGGRRQMTASEVDATLAASSLRTARDTAGADAGSRFARLHAGVATAPAVDAQTLGEAFDLLPALDSALRARLAGDTVSPRLLALRRLARADTLPIGWRLRGVVASARSPLATPQLSAVAVVETGLRNEAAALLAIARGDTAGALQRARENVAAARQLTRVANTSDDELGATLALQARDVMRAAARLTRSTALRAESDAIERAAEALQLAGEEQFVAHARALFADPSDTTGVMLFGDRRLTPGTRVALAIPLVMGHCLNAREMLFGVDARRLALLSRADAQLRDLPGGSELLRPARNWLEEWTAHQRTTAAANRDLGGAGEASLLLRSLGWIGLGGIRDRMITCRQI